MKRSAPRRLYLDHASATALRPEALEAMLACWRRLDLGNAGAAHAEGRAAAAAIEEARESVAALLGAPPPEIVFTSGGTEALNLAVKGAARAATPSQASRIVTSAVEHLAVLHPLQSLQREGFEVVALAVEPTGRLEPPRVAEALADGAALFVSHHANHEVGVFQPITEAAAAAREHGVVVVCDATATAGQVPIDVDRLGADLLAITAHRFGGPPGVGALRVRAGTRLRPIIEGGIQENGLRGGTENVPGVVGMGVAAKHARGEIRSLGERLDSLAGRLRRGIVGRVRDARVVSPAAGGLPGLCNVVFPGLDAEALLALLDDDGIAAISGSACYTGAGKPSHVLLAMGISESDARASVLFTFGASNTEAEVDRLLALLPDHVERLRRLSPP